MGKSTSKIEKIIEESLKETAKLVLSEGSDSKIIIPFYRKNEDDAFSVRYSEQELKQIFLTHIEKSTPSYYYSVETPSKFVYSISNSIVPDVKERKEKDDHYESARIDTSIYSSHNPQDLYCHIEFKYGNTRVKEVAKDFLRLMHELGESDNNYFIHYAVRESNKWKTGTFPSIMDKYMEAINIVANKEKNLSKVWIYLMFIKIDKKKEIFTFKFNLEQLKKNFNKNQKYSEKEIYDLGWSIQI